MTTTAMKDPLAALRLVLPDAPDADDWRRVATSTSADTDVVVHHYQHRTTLRTLRLDDGGRVYGQDPEGVVRLFGRGGPLALHVALNMVFDGFEECRPRRVVSPRSRVSRGPHAPRR